MNLTLAILGGSPAFAEMLHVGRPNLVNRDRVLARLETMWESRWLTNRGPFVREFEAQLAAQLGVRHCIAMCNATIALEITVRACDMHGEVIVPSFTFIATAHCLQWQQIRPVFCDIHAQTHNIDPERIEELITPETTGIIPVHVWGRPCDVEAIQEIGDKHGLSVVFDSAHALGCSYRGKPIGQFGRAEVFSFHATKFVNAFEGGAVATNDDALADKIRLMQNFGFSGLDNVIYIGTNGKMNEASAIMGLTSLEGMDDLIAINRAHYAQYLQELRDVAGISLVNYDDGDQCNYQYIVLEVDEAKTGLTRDMLIQVLHAENIRARRYFWPGCHRMEPYRSLYPDASTRLPATEMVAARVVVLPTGPSLTRADVSNITAIIRVAVERASEVRSCLDKRERSVRV